MQCSALTGGKWSWADRKRGTSYVQFCLEGSSVHIRRRSRFHKTNTRVAPTVPMLLTPLLRALRCGRFRWIRRLMVAAQLDPRGNRVPVALMLEPQAVELRLVCNYRSVSNRVLQQACRLWCEEQFPSIEPCSLVDRRKEKCPQVPKRAP